MALKEVSPQKGKIQHKLLKLGQALTHKIIIIFCYILNFYIQNNDFMRITFFDWSQHTNNRDIQKY